MLLLWFLSLISFPIKIDVAHNMFYIGVALIFCCFAWIGQCIYLNVGRHWSPLVFLFLQAFALLAGLPAIESGLRAASQNPMLTLP